jgi:(p)ppGpp synthase/HD superfamily hydrolase
MLNDLHSILEAARFAAEKHAAQRRKGATAEPYVNHLLEVAELVSGAISESNPNLVIAALLHDTVEDVGVTREDLVQRFGSAVADMVMEVTDDKSLPKDERKRLQIEHAPKLSVGAQTIKLADKISNLRAILISPPVSWSSERQKQYFEWAKQVVDAMPRPNPILKAEFERTFARFRE